ncbi:MAG: T9SS type A sorting domain-containing protein [Ignavibacteriae bacterium]|nr:T9SS type A sorting domain-containing protein [Ignavibacteriota bacterium]
MYPDSRYSITWNSNDVKSLSLYYTFDDATWTKIDHKINSVLRSYSWKVPQINKPIKIKISADENEEIFDISDNFVFVNNDLHNNIFSFQKKTIDPVRILPLGNSITFDNRSKDTRVVEDKIGYRFPLFNLLHNKGYSFEFIGSEHAGSNFFSNDENAGFPGIRSSELANLLITGRRYQPFYSIDQQITPGPYLETYNPNIILIHIGTNNNDNPVDGTIPDYMEQILDEIDRYEQDNDVDVIVILARIIDRVPNENYVTALNNNVVEMALDRVNNPLNNAYPDRIIVVDMESGADIDYVIDSMGTIGNGIFGDMNDALHPNDKGYQKMANVWFEALDSILDTPIIINKQPSTKFVIEGETVEFIISATSLTPITYQWKKNGIDLVGENDSILILENVKDDLNNSVYTCQVTSWGKSIESNQGLLIVTNSNSRVSSNILTFYEFNEGTGKLVHDRVTENLPLNLEINSIGSYEWFYNSLKISESTIIQSENKPKKLYDSLINSNEITVELWLKPESTIQNGPARIITFSPSRFERNFGLLQNGNRYEFRLRTSSTDNNGIPSLISNAETVTTNLTHFLYTFSDNDTAKMYINGVLQKEMHLSGVFNNWDSTYLFGIANEFNDSKPWLGTYYLIAIYNRALNENEIQHNFSKGVSHFTNINAPTNLIVEVNQQEKINLTWVDNSSNEIGYKILRKESYQQNFEFIDSVLSNVSVYTDNSAEEGKKYSYCVVAFNNFGISESSNISGIFKKLNNPTDLTAIINDQNFVELSWQDQSQSELGFIIESKPAIQDSNYKVIGTVNSNTVNYIDTVPKFISPYYYRVYAFTNDTISQYSNEYLINVVDVKSDKVEFSTDYELFQNFPNPFNPTTNITYNLLEESTVKLELYDILGQKVFELVNEVQKQGKYEFLFNASNLSSGTYLYKLNATSTSTGKVFEDFRKLILIK